MIKWVIYVICEKSLRNCSLKSVTPTSGEALLQVLFVQVHQPVHSALPILTLFLLSFFGTEQGPLVGVRDCTVHTSRLLTVLSVPGHRHELRWQDTLRLLIGIELPWVEKRCPADAILVTVTGAFNRLWSGGVSSDIVIGHINLLLKLSTLFYVRGCRLFIHHVAW